MKLISKRVVALVTTITTLALTCFPAFAGDSDVNLGLQQRSSYVVAVPGSLTFDPNTYEPNVSVINMSWQDTNDLTQTLNLAGGTSLFMVLSAAYTGYDNRPYAYSQGYGGDNVASNGVVTVVDSKTADNSEPNKLYFKIGVANPDRYSEVNMAKPLEAGIGMNTTFGYVQLKENSSTEYEDIVGGMTISNMYIDKECTIPADQSNVRAGDYRTNLVFSINTFGL